MPNAIIVPGNAGHGGIWVVLLAGSLTAAEAVATEAVGGRRGGGEPKRIDISSMTTILDHN